MFCVGLGGDTRDDSASPDVKGVSGIAFCILLILYVDRHAFRLPYYIVIILLRYDARTVVQIMLSSASLNAWI